MTKLNFLSAPLLLVGALVGLTLAACDLGPKMIGNETEGALDCQNGDTKPSDDGCNTCSCLDGEWACTEKACEGQSSGPVQCEEGAMMPDPDGCNTCTCINGGWACTAQLCDATGGWDTEPSQTATGTSTMGQTSATDSTGDIPEPPPAVPCDGEAIPLADIPTILAYTQAQVPPQPDTTGGSSGTTGGGELDPGTIFVTLSDQPLVCADPNAALQCGGHWEVTLVIPPEFQSPGIYNLLGQDVRGNSFETGADGNQDCSFGGGSFDATFEIFAVDDNTVSGRLCHVNSFFSVPTPSLEGSFSAPRCQ
jgi:hypothetical protein